MESGSNDYPVRRLRFSQDLSSGHFDAYLPIAAQKITRRRMEAAVEELDFGIDTPSQFKVDKGCQEVPVLEFYVACSRVSSPNNLIILAPNDRLVKNIVYKEVL